VALQRSLSRNYLPNKVWQPFPPSLSSLPPFNFFFSQAKLGNKTLLLCHLQTPQAFSIPLLPLPTHPFIPSDLFFPNAILFRGDGSPLGVRSPQCRLFFPPIPLFLKSILFFFNKPGLKAWPDLSFPLDLYIALYCSDSHPLFFPPFFFLPFHISSLHFLTDLQYLKMRAFFLSYPLPDLSVPFSLPIGPSSFLPPPPFL